MRAEPDKTDVGVKLSAEPTHAEVGDRIKELLDSLPPGRTCPKCGGSMAHYRLHGYRCIRGCL